MDALSAFRSLLGMDALRDSVLGLSAIWKCGVAISKIRRTTMEIGERLKALREQKDMSQGDVEKRTGLLRCYISRVENGHTVPAIETIEKLARALEVPMYAVFYEAEPPASHSEQSAATGWGSSRRDARTLHRFRKLMGRMNTDNQKLLLHMAQKMVQQKAASTGK
jgi:transcriptional regulator with XRE-family HTH domain